MQGLGGLAGEEPAAWTRESALAIELWRFMGGWYPERLPIAIGLHDVADVDGMLDRVICIRDTIAEYEALQVEARGARGD